MKKHLFALLGLISVTAAAQPVLETGSQKPMPETWIDGQWIYLFKPEGDHIKAEKLVNMKHHNYKLEPNVHFSPDGKWIIFRANFEGDTQVYAVKIQEGERNKK
jgi:hypothetical protein